MAASREINTYNCHYCDASWITKAQLRNHINRSRNCYAKWRAGQIDILTPQDTGPGQSLDVDLDVGVTESIRTGNASIYPDNDTLPFDSGLQLLFGVTSFNSGAGLSDGDMDKLIRIITHPLFKAADIPYKSGKGARRLMEKLWKKICYEQVICLLQMCCFV